MSARTYERNAATKRELHDALDALEAVCGRNEMPVPGRKLQSVRRVLAAWRAYRARFKVPVKETP
jgi:hypothetical protein